MSKHIGGFGGIKIELPGYYEVDFSEYEAIGKVEIEDELVERTDLNGEEQEWYLGSRAVVHCKLFNIEAASYVKFKILAQLIDMSRVDRLALRVYPHYNENSLGSEYYDCICKGGWAFEPVFDDIEAGQILPDLIMRGKYRLTGLPQHVDYTIPDIRVTADGDTRVTADGDIRVVAQGV